MNLMVIQILQFSIKSIRNYPPLIYLTPTFTNSKNRKEIKKLMSNFISELIPTNGGKSFYGKAKILHSDKGKKGYDRILLSYETPVMLIREKTNEMFRLCENPTITRTTATHIKSFSGLSKKEFLKLPLINDLTIIFCPQTEDL